MVCLKLCAKLQVAARAFVTPSKKGLGGTLWTGEGVLGVPKLAKLDALSRSAEGKALVWSSSEAATGPFFGGAGCEAVPDDK